MELIFLGTGCPAVSKERYGPAHLLEAAGRRVLIDCGSGVTQRLVQARTSGAAIDLLLLTHLHSDHLVDLFQLLISGWHQGRKEPLKVAGPKGTGRYVEGLLTHWRAELDQRVAFEKRPSDTGLKVEVEEIGDGWTKTLDDLEIEAFAVEHLPVKHAFGFSLTAGGKRLVVSGDTRRCDAVIEAARGCDLLLHEVFIHHAMAPKPGVRDRETIEQVASYHTLSQEVGKIASEAGAKVLALTHFVPPDAGREELLAEVRQDYDGPVILGEDLMRYDLVSGRLVYGQATLSISPGKSNA